jgi:hypothetical protein
MNLNRIILCKKVYFVYQSGGSLEDIRLFPLSRSKTRAVRSSEYFFFVIYLVVKQFFKQIFNSNLLDYHGKHSLLKWYYFALKRKRQLDS